MSMKTKRRLEAALKAKSALEARRRKATIAELAAPYLRTPVLGYIKTGDWGATAFGATPSP
jgi:hypothetical protein